MAAFSFLVNAKVYARASLYPSVGQYRCSRCGRDPLRRTAGKRISASDPTKKSFCLDETSLTPMNERNLRAQVPVCVLSRARQYVFECCKRAIQTAAAEGCARYSN